MEFSNPNKAQRFSEAATPFLHNEASPRVLFRADEMAFQASEALPTKTPAYSAKTGLTTGQRIAFGRLATLTGLLGLFLPTLLMTGLWGFGILAFSSLILWRILLVLTGMVARLMPQASPLSDQALPIYTLLVPLYDEAAAIPALAQALNALDYPTERLDIKLLAEIADTDTLEALAAEYWGPHVEILALPEGTPLTKPRALNFGFQCVRGEFIAIYDAEDRPHPTQLRTALAAFTKGGRKLACVQAPLKAHNQHESWLAGQWSLEYAVHFYLIMPALTFLRLPVPLGGTSNHFRREALEEIGGWDAWNVTEDADLGLRLARFGWRVGSIRPPTLEEAPETLPIWTAQRSRWIKGYMQTWLVLMRSPHQTIKDMGLVGFCATQLTLGGSILSALVNGPLFIWVISSLLTPSSHLSPINMALLGAGYLVNAIAALIAPGRFSLTRVTSILTLPLYWPLQSIAAVRALYGLTTSPHFWAKTPHGLTTRRMDPTLAAFAE